MRTQPSSERARGAKPLGEQLERTSGSEGATRTERGAGVPASERVGESEGRSPSEIKGGKRMTRIVLAHSGGFETAIAIPWLRERYDAEVVALTLDLGQGGELTDVRERALAAGAVRAHVIDAREEFLREYVLPSLHAGAAFGRRGPTAQALARALVARRALDVARMEGASAIAYGS